MASKTDRRKTIDQVFVLLGVIVMIFLIVIGSLAWYGGNFAKDMVRTELSAQKIYFPAAGSPGLTAEEYPTLQQYGGMLVDDGIKAKAYANEFIGAHLQKIAGGKTYAEVSALAKADPTNTTLAGQKASLFQGETLRGLLLGNGYAYWVFGQIATTAAYASFIGAALMFLLVLMGWQRVSRS